MQTFIYRLLSLSFVPLPFIGILAGTRRNICTRQPHTKFSSEIFVTFIPRIVCNIRSKRRLTVNESEKKKSMNEKKKDCRSLGKARSCTRVSICNYISVKNARAPFSFLYLCSSSFSFPLLRKYKGIETQFSELCSLYKVS